MNLVVKTPSGIDPPAPQPLPIIPFGKFRSNPEYCQIDARDDIQAIKLWLAEFHDSPNTLSSYRKEAERLLLWANGQDEPRAISGLTRDDFMRYERFLADPQPASKWVGPPLPRSNPNWKPFTWRKVAPSGDGNEGNERRGGLSPSSRAQAMDVIRSMFGYLHKVGYLSINPVASKTKKRMRSVQRKQIQRFLPYDTWEYLLDFIERMPKDSVSERRHYHRVRWLFCLLYLTRARRSEIAAARMSDIYRDDTDGLWYFKVMGKGLKERDIPVSDELLKEFMAYRQFLGKTPLPSLNDDRPLVLSVTGRSGLTPKAVYLIIKEVCFRAAETLRETYPDDPVQADRANRLAMATTHWLRHTSATHFVDAGGDLRVIQETLGHSNIQTTMIYQHAEKTDLHEKSSRQKLKRS